MPLRRGLSLSGKIEPFEYEAKQRSEQNGSGHKERAALGGIQRRLTGRIKQNSKLAPHLLRVLL
jgi:hypothetical protein